jgi:hypothetical protein
MDRRSRIAPISVAAQIRNGYGFAPLASQRAPPMRGIDVRTARLARRISGLRCRFKPL